MDALPESVIRFQSAPTGPEDASIVAATAFVAVPQSDGRELHVVFPDTKVDRRMRQMLTRLGGTPLP